METLHFSDAACGPSVMAMHKRFLDLSMLCRWSGYSLGYLTGAPFLISYCAHQQPRYKVSRVDDVAARMIVLLRLHPDFSHLQCRRFEELVAKAGIRIVPDRCMKVDRANAKAKL